ncbi:hypothetical protein [Nocardia sp. NPDC005998]|uniref:hypothetical protein n=1 Tax=Nocardia sp. NPDC005998 TaxID=3156894 RepID=UPI0033AB126E
MRPGAVLRLRGGTVTKFHLLCGQARTGPFLLDDGTFKPTVPIAAGIGITPMRAMLQDHLTRGESAPPLWLFYCAKSSANQAFRAAHDDLFATRDGLQIRRFFSRPGQADPLGTDYHHPGRISAEAVIETVAGRGRLGCRRSRLDPRPRRGCGVTLPSDCRSGVRST